MTKVILHTWGDSGAQVYNCLDALLTAHEEGGAEDDVLDELREAFADAHDMPGKRVYMRGGTQSITVFPKMVGEAEREERLFALLNAQGTACAETVLRESNFTTAERERVERNVARDKSADPPIPRTWTDVSDNDVCREAIE